MTPNPDKLIAIYRKEPTEELRTIARHAKHPWRAAAQAELERRRQRAKRNTAERDPELQDIALRYLRLPTLEIRSSDELDFSEQAVWRLRAALEAAYEAGRKSRRRRTAAKRGGK